MKTLSLCALLMIATFSCTKEVRNPIDSLLPINGTDLYVRAFGEGTPLLVIHGGPGLSHDYFLPHLEELAKTNYLIFYDHRGAGRSSMNQDSTTMNLSTFVEDIESIRKHFNIEHIDILAHSWGALLAVNYAVSHSEHLGKLILSNPSPLNQQYNAQIGALQAAAFTDTYTQKRNNILNSEAFKNRDIAAFEDLFKLNFSLTFKDSTNLEKLNLNFLDTFLTGNQLLQSFSGLESYDYYEDVGKISSPVLVMRGAFDLSSPNADQRTSVSFQNGILFEFHHSGHFPFIEEQELFVEKVHAFLSRTPKSTGHSHD